LAFIEGNSLETVPSSRQPTIRDLLIHRSGLTYGWFGPEKLDAIYRSNSIPNLFEPTDEMIRDRVTRIANVPLKFQPGTAWDYSVSTDVLGRVVEVASGLTLDQFFRERFFRPLKMDDTFFHVPEDKQGRLAGLYTLDKDKHLQPVTDSPVQSGFLRFSGDYCTEHGRFYSGGGGLVSSTLDYVRFLQMLLNGGELDGMRVLKRETVDLMTQTHIGEMTIPFPGHGDGFGFGFGVVTDRSAGKGEFSVGTFSWGGIFNTYFWVDPQEQLVGVLMTQVFPNDHLTVRDDFRKLVYAAIDDSGFEQLHHYQPGTEQLTTIPDTTAIVQVESAQDESAGDLDCFRITTPTAIYYLDKVGAGLSSMIDRDGNDWISFQPQSGSGAAGEYRGFPNAVFKEAGSYFHPRNSGTDPCVTRIEQSLPDRVVISAVAENGKWAGQYTFTRRACTFTMLKKPEGHKYWVLYEGTPGGQYDESDWWMTADNPTKRPLTEPFQGDLNGDVPSDATCCEWIAFGDKDLKRMLVLSHAENDSHPDHFYQMEKNMTVFGFGRAGMRKYLSTVPQSFSIGFVESTDHHSVQRFDASVVQEIQGGDQEVRSFERFAMTQHGDAQAGAKLFKDQRTKCDTCHRIGQDGGQVGPDLSSVGGKFDRPHLIDALLYPSRQIGYGYETTTLITRDGAVLSGIAKEADEANLTLLNANNIRIRIDKADIEEIKVSKISIMPTGIATSLSRQEFTDLIAYLESLGPGNGKMGSGVSGPVQIPDGFELTTVATGLSGAVAFDVAPDGRIFVCEQGGTLRVIKEGKLLEKPFVTIPVEMNWERGLIGVTLAPSFPSEPYVYLVYVTDKPHTHHRISRFRADGDVAIPGSEEILFCGDDQSKFGGNVPAGHQGGGIHFGPDGKLYVGLGEQTAGAISQQMNALQGKILRLNPDGSIPPDNPFLKETDGKYQAIWAKGCRNPFTFAFSENGDMLINDVGGAFEEVNRGIAGANYGWPIVDHGPTMQPSITGPIHVYPQSSINGGDFCSKSTSWPTRYRGRYFFADFVHGWVKYIDPSDPKESHEFLSGIRRPVDLRFADDGSLYVLLRNAWVVDKNFVGGTGAMVKVSRLERDKKSLSER
jgi:putative heme-binding domain-containing protein